MKKIFMLAAMIVAMITATAFAAQSTKVVIIAGAEFKTADYYKIIQKNLGVQSKTAYEANNDIQKKYHVFMMKHYDIGETAPKKQDLANFVKESGYGKVLFLMLDENIDTQTHGNHSQKNRSTIQLDAYLVDSEGIIDVTTTSQDFVSKASNLRARRGAFEKCLKEVATAMNLL